MNSRYFIQTFGYNAFDIYTENGSFAQCYNEEGTWKTKYYKKSWKDFSIETLQCTNPEIKDWGTSSVEMQTMIADAIEYMESGAGYGWEKSNRVYSLDEFRSFTRAEVIEQVNKSISSIFSKDDVIKLIMLISPAEIDAEPETKADAIDTERLQELVLELDDVLENLKHGRGIDVNEQNTTFRVRNGNEIEVVDIDYDTDEISRDLGDVIEAITKEFLTK